MALAFRAVKPRPHVASRAERKEMLRITAIGNYLFPKSRYSVAMLAANYLAQKYNLQWENRGGTFVASGPNIQLTRPKVYNVSEMGKWVTLGEDTNHILMHYDLDLELGCAEFQRGNILMREGKHPALESIARYSGTENFQRLAIGIGRPKTEYYQENALMAHTFGEVHYKSFYLMNKWPDDELFAVQHVVCPNIAELIHDYFINGKVDGKIQGFDYWTTMNTAKVLKEKMKNEAKNSKQGLQQQAL